jgi:hypothetical protein
VSGRHRHAGLDSLSGGLLRETIRVPHASVTRTWSDPQPQRVHAVLPAAVVWHDTTWKGSAPSGQPQCGQRGPVVLVIGDSLTLRA